VKILSTIDIITNVYKEPRKGSWCSPKAVLLVTREVRYRRGTDCGGLAIWQSLTLMSHLWTGPQSSSQHAIKNCHLSRVVAVSTASEQSTLRLSPPQVQNSMTTNYPVFITKCFKNNFDS
jgi:hypothetical protein